MAKLDPRQPYEAFTGRAARTEINLNCCGSGTGGSELLRLTDLGVKGATRVAEVLGVTQDEAGQDLLFLDALEPQFEVLAGTGVFRLHVI